MRVQSPGEPCALPRSRRSEVFGPRVVWLDLDETFADPSKVKPKGAPLDDEKTYEPYKNFF